MNPSPIVIKIGGEIVESPELLQNLSKSLIQLREHQIPVVLVHGGGPLATQLSDRLGLPTQMVGGRRITSAEVLEVMKMSLAGVMNSDVLAALRRHKVPVAAVNGVTCVVSQRRPPKKVSGANEPIDFGFVGDVVQVETSLIEALLEHQFIPVLCPLTADEQGQIYNTNADTVAVRVALALKAKSLALITQIGGVFRNVKDPATRLTRLSVSQASELIASGQITGGMIPKLEDGFQCLKSHLKYFHIVGLTDSNTLAQELQHPGSCGTVIYGDNFSE